MSEQRSALVLATKRVLFAGAILLGIVGGLFAFGTLLGAVIDWLDRTGVLVFFLLGSMALAAIVFVVALVSLAWRAAKEEIQ